jgi:hypothetical protein
MNLSGILLVYVALLVFAGAAVVALGLLIARRTKAARIVFAVGLFGAAVIGAFADLTYLEEYWGDANPTIILTALSLLLVGTGQLVAAFQSPRAHAATLWCGLGALVVFLLGAMAIMPDFLGGHVVHTVFARRNPSLPVSLGLGLCLSLAALSVMIAVCPSRRTSAVLWTALAALGGIGGFAVGDACVSTRCTVLQNSYPLKERVEVRVLGMAVSDETGFAPRQWIPAVSGEQAAWVYGPLAVGAAVGMAVGLVAAWGIARSRIRPSVGSVHAEARAHAERPGERGDQVVQIKPGRFDRNATR